MLLQVHDELIFELPKNEIPKLTEVLESVMPMALELVVPLTIELKTGLNWRDMDPHKPAGTKNSTRLPKEKTSKN